MEPSPEYLRIELELADEALSDATFLLEWGRFRAAANRAYYAMFHAATAALDSDAIQRARTHRGAIHLFREHFVRTGRVDEKFARQLQVAYSLRQNSDYEGSVAIEEGHVTEIVLDATDFVEVIKSLIPESPEA